MSKDSLAMLQSARSFLFVPGDRPERFSKAQTSGADVVILDLEDAVSARNKDSALLAVTSWLSGTGQAVVRIERDQELASLRGIPGLIGVMVPKSENPDHVSRVHQTLGCPVLALIESASGVVAAHSLASVPGVARLAFGELDFAADIAAQPNQRAMLLARSSLVLASRAQGLPGPLDGVTPKFDDDSALTQDLHAAIELGMSGKLLIHPRQVAVTHHVFRPSDHEVAWAHRIVKSISEGGAVVKVDSAMVDAPVLRRAQAILGRLASDARALVNHREAHAGGSLAEEDK
ncbi:CoA ester lyase [Paenarthrobacter sp. RAF54_2]|uniref:HpcH/HpaI aldolase/citrate lyase family protein n=1 Tax=Paenarthrobacter sp. RAF54_2 TaxID=3233061 RepID=UPI003F99AC2D